MTNKLRPDSRWQTSGVKSIDDFTPVLNSISFLDGVSEDVQKRFERVKSILCFSYYDYELLDVAADYALLSLELAISQRYTQLEHREPGNKTLKPLIAWGVKNNLFELKDLALQSLEALRNFSAHPRRYLISGLTSIDLVLHTVGLINGMYQDVDLRRQRNSVMDQVNGALEELLPNGALVEVGGARLKVFKTVLLHYENRVNPPLYYFAFWKTFDLTPDESNTIHEGEPLIIQATRYETVDDSVVLISANSSIIRIVKPSIPADIEELSRWISDLNQKHTPEAAHVRFELSLLRTQIQRYYSSAPASPPNEHTP